MSTTRTTTEDDGLRMVIGKGTVAWPVMDILDAMDAMKFRPPPGTRACEMCGAQVGQEDWVVSRGLCRDCINKEEEGR